MSKMELNGVEFEFPDNWGDQGMVTLTIPNPDEGVRPNIIVTKEKLNENVDIETYFKKIKEAVQARGINTFEILDERPVLISGVSGMQMVCRWDLAAMKQIMGPNNDALKNIKAGQKVQQVQVSLIKNQIAINITASFPADQFEIYGRPFQQFLKSLRVNV